MRGRSRIIDLITQKEVADAQLATERARGQRDAANAGAVGNLVTSSIKGVTDAGLGAMKVADQQALEDADTAALRYSGQLGDVKPPEQMVAPMEPQKAKPLDDVVTYKPPQQGPLKPTSSGPMSFFTAQPKPTPETEQRPVITKTVDPMAAPDYAQTPQQLAHDVVSKDDAFKPRTDIMSFFTNDGRARAARAAEAKIAGQVTQNRATDLGARRELQKYQVTRTDRADDVAARAAKEKAEQDRFTAKLEADRTAQAAGFKNAQEMQAAQQKFTGGQNDKQRATTLAAAKISADAAAKRASDKVASKPLEKAAVDDIAHFDEAISQIRRMKELKKNVDTGPLMANTPDALRSADGIKLRLTGGTQLTDTIHGISGAGVPLAERPIYDRLVPVEKDNDDDYVTKADELEKALVDKREAYLTALEDSGRDVSRYRARAASAQQAPRVQQKPREDRMDELLDGGLTPEQVKAQMAAEGYDVR